MRTKEFLEWLERKQLIDTVKDNAKFVRQVFTKCLNAKDEQIVIIGDTGYAEKRVSALLTGSYYFAAKELGLKTAVIVQKPKYRGEKASKELIDTLSELPRESIMIINLSSKLGSIKEISGSFRTFSKEFGHRFTSATNLSNIPTISYNSLLNAVDIDYDKLAKKAAVIKDILDNGNEVHVTTDKGTDLMINIEGMKAIANDGKYTRHGSGGNIPTGEVYIPPRWKKVEGKIVIDISSAYREGTQLIEEPIELIIKKGEITKIKGGIEAKRLEETLDWAYKISRFPWGVRRIGEFGIGINPRAEIIGSTIIDEKKLGTAHLAIGSNYWFGGTIYAIIHLDQVFNNPVVKVDKKIIPL